MEQEDCVNRFYHFPIFPNLLLVKTNIFPSPKIKFFSSNFHAVEEKRNMPVENGVPWKEINTDASFHTFSSKSIRHESRGKAEFARVIKNSGEESFTDSMNQRDNKSDDELLVGGQKSEGGGGGKKRAVDSARGVVNFHRPPAATKNEQSPAVSSLGWLFRFFAASWRRVAEKNGAIEECGFSFPPTTVEQFVSPLHAKSRARSGIIVFLEIPSLWWTERFWVLTLVF